MMSFETGPAPQPGALTSTATLADAISRELIMLEGKSGNTRLVGSMEEILGDGAPVLTRSGLVMSATQALAVSTVFACRRVIAEDIASMRIEIVRREWPRGVRKTTVLNDHYLAPLLNAASGMPCDWLNVFDFVQHLVGVATMYRGAYATITRDDKGRVLELLPLLPGAVQESQEADWRPVYRVHGYGDVYEAKPGNLLRLHGPMADNALHGMPLSTVAREAVALAAAVEGAAARFHKNDMRPSGALSIDGTLTEEQAHKIRDDWSRRYGPEGQGGIALLTGKLEFKPFNATSADSQTIENRKFQVEEICRYFRVFPVAIGHQAGQGYGTVESFLEAHYTHTLRPWEIKLEQALNSQLLTKKERLAGIQIRLVPARRGTFSDRANAYRTATGVFMTPNEAREMEDMDPIEGDPDMDRVQIQRNNTGTLPAMGGKPQALLPAPDKPAAADSADGGAKGYGFAPDLYGHEGWLAPEASA